VGLDQTARLALVIDADISGTTFTEAELVNTDETLVVRSLDGTFDGIGDGSKVWEGSIQVGGTGNATGAFSPNVDVLFGQNKTASLIGQGIGGTGSGISTMRISEDW
jgi:hypothetical protein